MRIGLFVDSVFTAWHEGESYVTSGGVGVYAKELLTALLQAEDKNEYLIIRGRPASAPLISHPRVREVSPSHYIRSMNRIGLWREWVLKNEKIDVLHEMEPSAGTIRFHDYPLVITVHDLIPLLYPETFHFPHASIFKAFSRKNLTRADAVITVSQNTYQDMRVFFPGILNKTTPIHIAGQSLDYSSKPDPDLLKTLNITKPYILSVATLEPRKNHKALLDAYSLLRESGTDLQLVLIGSKGWKNSDLNHHETLKMYASDILVPGVVSPCQLANIYQLASVFVYPSFYEGFGMPALEAAAASVPVIVGRNSSLPEIMGEAAYYVSERPGGEEIAAAITQIILHQDLKTRLSKQGIKQAASFSWQKTAQQTLEIYRQAVRGQQ